MSKMELILGTANFYNQYAGALLTKAETERILTKALDLGITTFETAKAYNCYNFLKKFLPKDAKIIYKVTDLRDVDVNEHMPWCVMLHNGYDKNLIKYLKAWKAYGKLERVGVSVYEPQEIDPKKWGKWGYQILQIPLNLANQTWLKEIRYLKKTKKTIHVRSVFLQGQLLNKYGMFKGTVDRLDKPLKACIDFVRCQEVDGMVVGVNNAEQLVDIYKAMESPIVELDWHTYIDYTSRKDPRTWG